MASFSVEVVWVKTLIHSSWGQWWLCMTAVGKCSVDQRN